MLITNVQVVEEDGIDPDNMTYEARLFCPLPSFFLFVAICIHKWHVKEMGFSSHFFHLISGTATVRGSHWYRKQRAAGKCHSTLANFKLQNWDILKKGKT